MALCFELTDIELKLLALRASAFTGSEEVAGHVIKELSATEHNFVLKKGESTVNLEKQKIDVSIVEKGIEAGVRATTTLREKAKVSASPHNGT